jgi:hypothetical protein
METRDVNVGTAGLDSRLDPARIDPRDRRLELGTAHRQCFDDGRNPRERIRPPALIDMNRTAQLQKSFIAEIRRWPTQEIIGRGRQRRDLRAAVTLQPEGCRAPGRVHPRMLLRLDQQGASCARHLGAQACPGDPAADDHDVESIHLRPGYGLERPAV